MTAAQKAARVKFNKAIAIRKKTGVSLKEAFAQVYGKKSSPVKKKAAKKSAPKKKVARKKASTIKKVATKAKKYVKSLKDAFNEGYYGTPAKKVATKKKKISEQAILNKIHKVKHDVDALDEAQHKHMMGAVNKHTLNELNKSIANYYHYKEIIDNINRDLKEKPNMPSYVKKDLRDTKKTFNSLMKEQKIHITQLKKHIK